MCSETVNAPLNKSSWCTKPLIRCINGPIGRLFTRISPLTVVPAGLRWANADISVLLPAPLEITTWTIFHEITPNQNHIVHCKWNAMLHVPGAHNCQQHPRFNISRRIVYDPFCLFFSAHKFTSICIGLSEHKHISPNQFRTAIIVRWWRRRIIAIVQFKIIIFHSRRAFEVNCNIYLLRTFGSHATIDVLFICFVQFTVRDCSKAHCRRREYSMLSLNVPT